MENAERSGGSQVDRCLRVAREMKRTSFFADLHDHSLLRSCRLELPIFHYLAAFRLPERNHHDIGAKHSDATKHSFQHCSVTAFGVTGWVAVHAYVRPAIPKTRSESLLCCSMVHTAWTADELGENLQWHSTTWPN
jgi:hypothetical protein